jgi:hypothetical protein
MTFLYPILLGGVVLAGIPIVLHLIMRQKPKHLLFPAFRFLMQQHRTNQRKLRLRHLLLLALRLLLVVGICLALARPKIFSERFNLGGERPVAAVLVFDTSYSMGYVSGGRNRLDEAKQRAGELLDELSSDSRIAVLDTAEPGGEWLATASLARERIGELRLHPGNSPVTARLSEAYRLLADLDQETENNADTLPRFIYVFTDRTQESWDPRRVHDLQQFRDRLGAPAHGVIVDVGTDSPVDVALPAFEMTRQIIPTNDKLVMRVTVSSTGTKSETDVVCRIDGEKAAERKPVQLEAGQSQVLTFERAGLHPGVHQAEITLGTSDSLQFNNALYATFEVRGLRQVLVLVDAPHDADILKIALESNKQLGCTIRTVEQARDLSPAELTGYRAICLLNVAHPSTALWELLERYVKDGGGLAVAPGGEELDRDAYNKDAVAQRLLPALLSRVVQSEAELGTPWKAETYRHPILAPFRDWANNRSIDLISLPGAVRRYWEVEPYAGTGDVIVSYADKPSRPALLERRFPGPKPGRVLLYTTPIDRRHLWPGGEKGHRGEQPWSNYLTNSFYLYFVNWTLGYLSGDAEEANFNYTSGQTPAVPLPATPRFPLYTLQGPGLSPTESVVKHTEGQNELSVPQAQAPGNYTVIGSDNKPVGSFSVNVTPEESRLNRVPPETIEELFGNAAILPVGHGAKFHDALQGHWNQPVELFPWLMLLILFVLAFENFLANKFYRSESQDSQEEPATTEPEPAQEAV